MFEKPKFTYFFSKRLKKGFLGFCKKREVFLDKNVKKKLIKKDWKAFFVRKGVGFVRKGFPCFCWWPWFISNWRKGLEHFQQFFQIFVHLGVWTIVFTFYLPTILNILFNRLSISFKYYFFILSLIFLYSFLNISLFFLYSFPMAIFFKFPTAIFLNLATIIFSKFLIVIFVVLR